ncbi:transporter [Fusarium pseudocircinatum]|uniref:Transporter n=1 Tax=Fusarium pseudocircinatum TaxID=56676 RepID=A0A8H5L330_9HYPO|nr:transporter [Fusarium pseudocircinatum]
MSDQLPRKESSLRPDHVEDLSQASQASGQVQEVSRAVRLALRKLDLIVIPLLTSIYLLAFLDRTNLGNARVAGLQRDLHLDDLKYRTALCVTYVPYILSEVPSNLIIKKLGPKRYLPALCLSWGIISTLQCVVHNYAGLIACRFLLGAVEGGLFPGLGAFSGLLAAAIENLDGIRGLEGWRWIFILEGTFTILWAFVAYAFLPNDPKAANFLSSTQIEEKLTILRNDVDLVDSHAISFRNVLSVFTDLPIVCVWVTSLCSGCSLYGLGYFTPTIVQSMGFDRTRTQLMTAPPYAAAVPITFLASWISIRFQSRGLPMIATYMVALTGAIMFLLGRSLAVRYSAIFLLLIGIYANVPCQVSWVPNYTAGHVRRATGIAMTTVGVNVGGIISTWIFPSKDAPFFRFAAAFLVGTNVLAILATCLAMWLWSRRNYQKQHRDYRQAVLGNISEETLAKQLELVGDAHPDYLYVL